MSTNTSGIITITHVAECNNCLHKLTSTSCKAFAEIPQEILAGKVQHRKKYAGDGGYRWEPV